MKRIAIFLCVCLLGAAVAWIAGFNFDHRNVDVALTAVAVGWLAFILAWYFGN